MNESLCVETTLWLSVSYEFYFFSLLLLFFSSSFSSSFFFFFFYLFPSSLPTLPPAVIYNYVVPVALYVSIEFQKFIGANFFRWDNDMRDGPEGEWPVCNTSDISEELGKCFLVKLK